MTQPSRRRPILGWMNPFAPRTQAPTVLQHAAALVWGAALVLILVPRSSASQELLTCHVASNAPSISAPGASSGVDGISVERVVGSAQDVQANVHLFLWNESAKELNALCAEAVLADKHEKPQKVQISLAQTEQQAEKSTAKNGTVCLTIQPAWKAFEARSFEATLRAGSDLIPLNGFVSLSANAQYKEALSSVPSANGRTKRGKDKGAQGMPQFSACTASSKPITRSILLLPMLDSGWFLEPMEVALLVAMSFFVVASIALRKSLGKMVGGPQWNFNSSFATNFTVGTGLASLLLGGNFISDALHYMTKLQYGFLSALFAAVLLLGPALFWFFGTPKETTTQAGAKTTVSFAQGWLLLVVVALMTGAVIGQLFTVGFAVAELWFRGVVGNVVRWGVEALLAVAAVGTVVCAGRTVRACLTEEPEEDETDRQVRSLKLKLSSAHSLPRSAGMASEMITRDEMDALDGMARERKPAAVWRMF
jgi:hypothetical protein